MGPTRPNPLPVTPAPPPTQTDNNQRFPTSPARSLPTVPSSYAPVARHARRLSDEDTDIPSNPAPTNLADIQIRYPPAPTIPLTTNHPRSNNAPTPASAEQRQLRRNLATMENELLICKYPPLPPFPIFLRPRPPSDAIIEAIRLVAHWQQPEPDPCHFIFDISADAASHNLHLLKRHQYDLEKAL